MPDFILHRIKPWLNASSEMAWMSPHSMGNLSSWRSWNKCHHHSHLFLWNPLLPRPSFLLTEDTMAVYWLVKKETLLRYHTCPSACEPWAVCVHLSLGMLWQESCLPWPNKSNWNPLCSSAQMQAWRGGIMGFLQGQFTRANPWHYSHVPLPWDKHILLVRKGKISDCQDHTWPITVQPERNLNEIPI